MNDREILETLERDYSAMYAADNDIEFTLFQFLRSRGFSARELNRHGYYSHGGKREGAGRKPSRKPLENLSTTIYKSDYNYLRKLAPTFREAIHQLVTNRKSRT